jgi:hypothetical protein
MESFHLQKLIFHIKSPMSSGETSAGKTADEKVGTASFQVPCAGA